MNLNLTELSLTYPLSCLAESSRHPLRLHDEVPTLIREDLHQLSFAVVHLRGVDHRREATADLREAISTLTDRGLCRGRDRPGNIGVHTEVAQGHIRPDLDPHQEDEEVEDGTALEGMAQDGEVQAIAVIVAMMIEAEAGVVEEEAEDGVETMESLSRKMALE